MSGQAPMPTAAASSLLPLPGESMARFDASVLQRYPPLANYYVTRVLAMQRKKNKKFHHFAAIVSKVPPVFYKELVNCAIYQTVRALGARLTAEHVKVRRLRRNLANILAALGIGDDPGVWYYLGYSLFGYTLRLASEIDERIQSEGDDFVDVDAGDVPPAEIVAEWTTRSQNHIVLLVNLVAHYVLEGAFADCWQFADACMRLYDWNALFAKFELQVLRDLEEDEGPPWHGNEDGGAYQFRPAPYCSTSYRDHDLYWSHPVAYFIKHEELHSLRTNVLHAPFVHSLRRRWNAASFAAQLARERAAIDTQNVLGLPKRQSASRLPADVATRIATFLAPTDLLAPELARQLAIYTSSANRHRARHQRPEPEPEQVAAADERHARLREESDELDAARRDERTLRASTHAIYKTRIADFIDSDDTVYGGVDGITILDTYRWPRERDSDDDQDKHEDSSDSDEDEAEDEAAMENRRMHARHQRFDAILLVKLPVAPREPFDDLMRMMLQHDGPVVDANVIYPTLRKVSPALYQELVDQVMHRALIWLCYECEPSPHRAANHGTPRTDRLLAGLYHILHALHVDDDEVVWHSIAQGLFNSTVNNASSILSRISIPTDSARMATNTQSIILFVTQVAARIIDGVFRRLMPTPAHCMQRMTWARLRDGWDYHLQHCITNKGEITDDERALDQEGGMGHRPRCIGRPKPTLVRELNDWLPWAGMQAAWDGVIHGGGGSRSSDGGKEEEGGEKDAKRQRVNGGAAASLVMPL